MVIRSDIQGLDGKWLKGPSKKLLMILWQFKNSTGWVGGQMDYLMGFIYEGSTGMCKNKKAFFSLNILVQDNKLDKEQDYKPCTSIHFQE